MRWAPTATEAPAWMVNWRAWTAGVAKTVEVLVRAARGRAKRAIGFERTDEIMMDGWMDGWGEEWGRDLVIPFLVTTTGITGTRQKKRRHSPRTRPARVPRTAYPILLLIFALTHLQRKRPTPLVDSTLSCRIFAVVTFGIPPHFLSLDRVKSLPLAQIGKVPESI